MSYEDLCIMLANYQAIRLVCLYSQWAGACKTSSMCLNRADVSAREDPMMVKLMVNAQTSCNLLMATWNEAVGGTAPTGEVVRAES